MAGIAEGCRLSGCALIGGETAEMPGLYQPGDYDLAGFAVGAAERGTILPRGDVAAGDVIIGMASSGVHSNGYSLVRKVVERSGLAWDATGAVRSRARASAMALLKPTRLYVKSCLAAIRTTGAVKALAHITGGGFPDNIPRALPKTSRRAYRSCAGRCAAGVSDGSRKPATSRCMKCCAPSIAGSA